MTIKVFVPYIWWPVPGVGNTGLSRYLFMCEASWMFGWKVCLSLPITDPHLGSTESINFPSCAAGIHWWELLLEGNEVRRGGEKLFVSFSICSLCATWVLIIFYVILQSKLSNAKWRLYISLWRGQFDKEGLQSCPSSRRCSNVPAVVQFSLIPATEDAQSLFSASFIKTTEHVCSFSNYLVEVSHSFGGASEADLQLLLWRRHVM